MPPRKGVFSANAWGCGGPFQSAQSKLLAKTHNKKTNKKKTELSSRASSACHNFFFLPDH
jgi:hypothetical protein